MFEQRHCHALALVLTASLLGFAPAQIDGLSRAGAAPFLPAAVPP